MSTRPWTHPAERRLLAMYHDGASRQAMADEFGRSINAIEHRLRLLLPTVGPRTLWSADEDTKLLQGIADGKDFETIAAELGRTVRGVGCRAERLRKKQQGSERVPPIERLASILRSKGWTCIPPHAANSATHSGAMSL